jgi:hypothetical protein
MRLRESSREPAIVRSQPVLIRHVERRAVFGGEVDSVDTADVKVAMPDVEVAGDFKGHHSCFILSTAIWMRSIGLVSEKRM